MSSGWVPVRMIRWPAQESDRARCVAGGIPHVVLVQAGSTPPEPTPTATVLFEPVSEHELARAVDELAWSGASTQSPPTSLPAARRSRSLVGLVAAML